MTQQAYFTLGQRDSAVGKPNAVGQRGATVGTVLADDAGSEIPVAGPPRWLHRPPRVHFVLNQVPFQRPIARGGMSHGRAFCPHPPPREYRLTERVALSSSPSAAPRGRPFPFTTSPLEGDRACSTTGTTMTKARQPGRHGSRRSRP